MENEKQEPMGNFKCGFLPCRFHIQKEWNKLLAISRETLAGTVFDSFQWGKRRRENKKKSRTRARKEVKGGNEKEKKEEKLSWRRKASL